LENDKWTRLANSQHQYVLIEPFKRGSFYSNTSVKRGHPEREQAFVMDVPKFHLYIDPKAIPPEAKEKMIEKLSSMFLLGEKEIAEMRAHFYKNKRSRKIIPWLDTNVQEMILSWWSTFASNEKLARNALYFVKDYKRSYPFGKMLGALLHTVQDQKDPKTFQSLPTGGLEMQFHSCLGGRLGKRILYRSPRHPLDMGKVVEAPEDGGDVYLTINHYLQAISEEILEKGVKKAGAKGGWVVMMEPKSGEILALAQYPSFDVTSYADYFNNPDMQEHTRIKAVTDAFEPGSIFKVLTMAIGLNANEEMIRRGEAPLFDPEEKIDTRDGSCPRTRFKLKDGRKRNYLNMYQALQKSSNIYPGKIVQMVLENLGEDWYRSQFVDVFGLGQKTNIEIPAETCGLVPKPGRMHPNGRPEWSVPTPFSLAIGHNILVNSIQIVKAYAMIANGGFEVRPTILKKIIKKDRTIDKTSPHLPKRVLSETLTKELIHGMKFVTKYGGTSPKGDIKRYTEVGKSGTSEKIINGKYSDKKYVSLFTGFAPAEKARIVMLVAIDEPELKWIPGVGKNHHGGVCAAPIFSEIGSRVLEYLGETPDDMELTDWKEETKELRRLYEKWNGG